MSKSRNIQGAGVWLWGEVKAGSKRPGVTVSEHNKVYGAYLVAKNTNTKTDLVEKTKKQIFISIVTNLVLTHFN